MRRRVEQPEDRLDAEPGGLPQQGRVGPAQHVGPQLDVGALQAADDAPVAVVERGEVAVLHADDVRLSEREVGVEVDQRGQHVVRRTAGVDDGQAPVDELLADVDEQPREDRLLGREVLVERRTADPARRAEVGDGRPVEAALGEQPRGLAEHDVAGAWCGHRASSTDG